ncbi:hypothetical protein DMC30DRAFT_395718 [Rhodotorula diobovata]|uniref:F-box domain-containing protein n=1 Tax=Rhodotorula diobovata TaxID=5288 RepID=A0A5C5FVZ1_9BASI|nr:hypothetical protein DMC30DRAFT_395718 [Rhodotorula diobovata]
MSTRAPPTRKSAAIALSYAEQASSSDQSEDGLNDSAGRGGQRAKGKAKGGRKGSKGKGKAVEVDDDDEGDDEGQPRKKARKAVKGKQKGRSKGTAKLEVLKTLPVEMLTEIFSHLDPGDLLPLSMVNKQYRSLLTAKSSGRLWKVARDRLKIKDLSAGGSTEWQYASLLFAKTCQRCNGGKGVCTFADLRVRYCNSCQAQQIVKLSALKRTHPKESAKLHPRAKEVVLKTPGWRSWTTEDKQCALLSDLQQATAVLRDLEAQDEDSDIAVDRPEPAPASSPTSTSFGRGRRSRAYASKTWSARQDERSDDEADTVSPFTRRVNEYVEKRKGVLKEINEDARKIGRAVWTAKRHLQEKQNKTRRDQTWASTNRSQVLKQKVFALGLGYVQEDFRGAWDRSKLVTWPEPVTDEEWERIKPKILKLLKRGRRQAEDERVLVRQRSLQRSLRPRYNQLKESLPKSARPFVPLFVDFLLLPSIRPLWETGDLATLVQRWDEALDAIKEDLTQFRLDLAIHAHSIVLEATTDPDRRSADDERDDDRDDLADVDLDAFFARATSFVCCGAKDCRQRKNSPYDPWSRTMSNPKDLRSGAVGPLVDVLEHLHENHNAADTIQDKRRFGSAPEHHIKLPLEVACAVSALLEVNQLNPATAGVAELERAEEGVRRYEWENCSSSWRNFYPNKAWFDLLYAVWNRGDKLSRLKPPVYLDPPVVVLHPLKHPRPGFYKDDVHRGGDSATEVSSSSCFGSFGGSDSDDVVGDESDW